MDVDEALTSLGRWGKWQILFYVLLSIANTFPASWHMLAIVFLGGQPEVTCKLPLGANKNASIPVDDKGKLSQCKMYKNYSLHGNVTIDCPNGWEYGGTRGPTIVSEWDLVCDRSFLVETTQTVMVIGVMFGAMFFSAMSDRYGRKPVFLFSEWAMVVVGVTTAFVNNYYLFSVLRFLAGALQQGIILTGFVMACELFPADLRTYAGMAIENFWALGMCILALFAYCIRNWRYLQLTLSLPAALTVAFFWFLPESIPWLVVNNKVDQAGEVLKKAARFNGITLPDKFLEKPETEHMLKQDGNAENADNEKKEKKSLLARLGIGKKANKPEKAAEADNGAVRYTIMDVVRNPLLRKYAFIMCCLWFVNSLVYYGLSLSTAALAGDAYLNFFLSGLVEIPAYTSCMFILQRFGRRWPLAIFHIVAGLALGITLFIPQKLEDGTSLMPLIMVFNMIGKFGITGSFGTVFLYAPEIFPTTLRNQAMGIASVGGRLGNMLAPFSNLVSRVVPWLPGILFGGLSIGVGLMVLMLPETLNRPLPQTIEDIENWTKKPSANRPKEEMVEMNNTGNPTA